MARSKGELIIFSLSSMQIAIISVVAILLLSFSFLLGIRIGRNQEPASLAVTETSLPAGEDVSKTEMTDLAAAEDPDPETEGEAELTFNTSLSEVETTTAAIDKPRVTRPQPKPVETTATEKYEKYTLQVASVKKREDAERFGRELSKKGFFTYVEEKDLGDKGLWYRVKLGGFPTMAEANSMKARLKDEHQLDSFVVRK